MFYPEEILKSDPESGVSTVWRAGNSTGTGNQRLNRRTVENVDLTRACETIQDPGAPLALRTEASLLLGAARLFQRQTDLVLADAERTRAQMMKAFKKGNNNQADPDTITAERGAITLDDAPGFDPFAALPDLGLLNIEESLTAEAGKGSSEKYSLLSLGGSPTLTPLRSGSVLSLDLPESSQSVSGYRIPHDMEGNSSAMDQEHQVTNTAGEFRLLGADEDFASFNNLGLDFDAQGNMVDFHEQEEPELPTLPALQERADAKGKAVLRALASIKHGSEYDVEGADDQDMLTMGEDEMTGIEKSVAKPAAKKSYDVCSQSDYEAELEASDAQEAGASNRRGRPKKLKNWVDEEISLPTQVIRDWDVNYKENMRKQMERKAKRAKAKAEKKAIKDLFDNGIAGVGNLGVGDTPHPLADMFAGTALMTNLGISTAGNDEDPGDEVSGSAPKSPARRRKAAEALREAEEEGRRVRQRADGSVELGGREVDNAIDAQDQLMLGDNSIPEIGMKAQAALEDRHSSMLAPGSAIRAQGSAQGSGQKGMQAPSPIFGRGENHQFRGIFNDESTLAGPSNSQLSSARFSGLQSGKGKDAAQEDGADKADKAESPFADAGHSLTFEEFARPGVHTKAIAADAFMTILELASKGDVKVAQEGRDKVPFGTIHIGFDKEEDEE